MFILIRHQDHIPNFKISIFIWTHSNNTFALPIPFVSSTIRIFSTHIPMITPISTADTMSERIKFCLYSNNCDLEFVFFLRVLFFIASCMYADTTLFGIPFKICPKVQKYTIGTTIGLHCFDYIYITTYQNIGDLFFPLHISRLSPSMQYPTPLYHCIDDVICKWFDHELGRFLDTDFHKQKFRLQCYESKLLKRLKSNATSTSLQLDLCNQSKLN